MATYTTYTVYYTTSYGVSDFVSIGKNDDNAVHTNSFGDILEKTVATRVAPGSDEFKIERFAYHVPESKIGDDAYFASVSFECNPNLLHSENGFVYRVIPEGQLPPPIPLRDD